MSKQKDFVHLPDLLFIHSIITQFGINRGVYNTIDTWFFDQGMWDIIERRKNIYNFLSNCHQIIQTKDGKMKFGSGNLKKQLMEYLKGSDQQVLSISNTTNSV